MRDYAKVSPLFWTGRTGRAIRAAGRDAQVIALYLITCPSATMTGLYYCPLPTLYHETGSPLQGASKALRRLSEVGFAYYDEATETVFVPEMAKFQIGETMKADDNRVKAIIKELIAAKSSPFVKDFHAKYAEAYHLPPLSDLKALQSPSEAPPKPLRSQEQEQEQEQETEREQEAPPALSWADYVKTFDSAGRECLGRIPEAVASTRKTGRVAPSVLDGLARECSRYPAWAVLAGAQIYLDRGDAAEGKDEKYLLGIIRGQVKRTSQNGNGHHPPAVGATPGQALIDRTLSVVAAEQGWR